MGNTPGIFAGHMVMSESDITVDDIFYAMMSETTGFLSIGGALERARENQAPDWAKIKDKLVDCQPTAEVKGGFCELTDAMEERMLRNAAILRVVGNIAKRVRIDFAPCDRLQRYAKAVGLPEGLLAVLIASAYQRWATQSEERALAEVHKLLWVLRAEQGIDYPAPLDGRDGLAHVFRQCAPPKKGKGGAVRMLTAKERAAIPHGAKRSRSRAAGLVSEALLVVHEYLGGFARARQTLRREERKAVRAKLIAAERRHRLRRTRRQTQTFEVSSDVAAA